MRFLKRLNCALVGHTDIESRVIDYVRDPRGYITNIPGHVAYRCRDCGLATVRDEWRINSRYGDWWDLGLLRQKGDDEEERRKRMLREVRW